MSKPPALEAPTPSLYLRILHYFDYLVGAAVVAYGAATNSAWLVLAGVLSLVLAYLNLGARLQAWLQRKFIRKHSNFGTIPEVPASADGLSPVSSPVSSGITAASERLSYRPRARYLKSMYWFGRSGKRLAINVPQLLPVVVQPTALQHLGLAPRPDQIRRR